MKLIRKHDHYYLISKDGVVASTNPVELIKDSQVISLDKEVIERMIAKIDHKFSKKEITLAYEMGRLDGMQSALNRSHESTGAEKFVQDRIDARDTFDVVITLDRLFEDGKVTSGNVIFQKIY